MASVNSPCLPGSVNRLGEEGWRMEMYLSTWLSRLIDGARSQNGPTELLTGGCSFRNGMPFRYQLSRAFRIILPFQTALRPPFLPSPPSYHATASLNSSMLDRCAVFGVIWRNWRWIDSTIRSFGGWRAGGRYSISLFSNRAFAWKIWKWKFLSGLFVVLRCETVVNLFIIFCD